MTDETEQGEHQREDVLLRQRAENQIRSVENVLRRIFFVEIAV